MRLSSSIMFVVGLVVFLALNEAQSFTLGRNVTIFLNVDYHDSSNETITDDPHLDSLELTSNQTSIEDVHHDSLDIISQLIKGDFKLALLTESTNASLVTDNDFSMEDLTVHLSQLTPVQPAVLDDSISAPSSSL